MSSNTPTVRQIAWISIIPHLLVMGVIMLIWYQFDKTTYLLYGAITYLIISQLLRRIIAKEHREGMLKVRQEKFEEAIPHFEKSYEFFKKNDWVDKYRFISLLSSAKMTYKEMALNNIAFVMVKWEMENYPGNTTNEAWQNIQIVGWQKLH